MKTTTSETNKRVAAMRPTGVRYVQEEEMFVKRSLNVVYVRKTLNRHPVSDETLSLWE